MLTDVSTVPPDHADTAGLLSATTDLAESVGLLLSTAEVIVIAGEAASMIRMLTADPRVIGLGDLQLAALLQRGRADWAAWSPADLTSGRITAELRRLGSGPSAVAQTLHGEARR